MPTTNSYQISYVLFEKILILQTDSRAEMFLLRLREHNVARSTFLKIVLTRENFEKKGYTWGCQQDFKVLFQALAQACGLKNSTHCSLAHLRKH
jgi:hypothetical protein